jgi:uncharacterized protein YcbK (DUF882 family)
LVPVLHLPDLPVPPARCTYPTRRGLLQLGAVWAASLGSHSSAAQPTTTPSFWAQPRALRLQSLTTTHKPWEFEYWRDGRLQTDAYLALSRLCQDTHSGQAVHMDARVFDLMFATQQWYQQATGKVGVHQITSAYRTPRTNAQVGGATNSLHLTGKALDGQLLGLDLATYAAMLQAFGAGGVGLYSRHVHWDVGRAPGFWVGGARE